MVVFCETETFPMIDLFSLLLFEYSAIYSKRSIQSHPVNSATDIFETQKFDVASE